MRFYPNQLFHIFNQGNNRQKIFFSDDNYEFFLWKMRAYLLPFGDLIAWCLMPNHYHWLFYVRQIEIERKILRANIDKVEYKRRLKKYGKKAMPVNFDTKINANGNSKIGLNVAIGELQRTYTRAINSERDMSGSLIRARFQSKDGWIDEFVTLRKKDGKLDYRFLPGTDFGFQCMKYLHRNPTKARLVVKDEDWLYSSAKDYAGLRKGS